MIPDNPFHILLCTTLSRVCHIVYVVIKSAPTTATSRQLDSRSMGFPR
jgi:hypothetical protein